MSTHPFKAIAAVSTVVLGFGSPSLHAAAMAFDDTSNPIYASNWSAGQNGGFGFGPWAMSFSGNAGPSSQAQPPMGTSPATSTSEVFPGACSRGIHLNSPRPSSHSLQGGVTGNSTLGIGEKFIRCKEPQAAASTAFGCSISPLASALSATARTSFSIA
jgi:hypothetical protein